MQQIIKTINEEEIDLLLHPFKIWYKILI